jgi:hypothetical protein
MLDDGGRTRRGKGRAENVAQMCARVSLERASTSALRLAFDRG